jgi:hypothetical protein
LASAASDPLSDFTGPTKTFGSAIPALRLFWLKWVPARAGVGVAAGTGARDDEATGAVGVSAFRRDGCHSHGPGGPSSKDALQGPLIATVRGWPDNRPGLHDYTHVGAGSGVSRPRRTKWGRTAARPCRISIVALAVWRYGGPRIGARTHKLSVGSHDGSASRCGEVTSPPLSASLKAYKYSARP